MNTNHGMTVRFWGVRGSYPATGSDTARYGGNTACVEIQVNGCSLILDAGTGIIGLGRALAARSRQTGQPARAVLLFSHLHHDHTQGFPFFTPAFIPGASVSIFGPDFLGSDPRCMLETVMQPPYFPLRLNELNANLSFEVFRETDVLLLGETVGGARLCPASSVQTDNHRLAQVRVLRSLAHPGGVLHFRVDWQGGSVVYATDTEGYVNGDRRLARFAHDTDLLIHDAQYTDEHYLGLLPGLNVTQGFGHSTVSMACQAAISAGARRLALFHHAPEYSDARLDEIATRAQTILPQAFVAQEGQEVYLEAHTSACEQLPAAMAQV